MKVTEFKTTLQYFSYFQTLVKNVIMPYMNVLFDVGATDACRNGCNVRKGSNVPKILHSVDERVDCVLLLMLVVLLSKHICDLILNKKHCKSLCWGKYMNLLMLL